MAQAHTVGRFCDWCNQRRLALQAASPYVFATCIEYGEVEEGKKVKLLPISHCVGATTLGDVCEQIKAPIIVETFAHVVNKIVATAILICLTP